ncbi:MAG: hypothetical protein ACTSVC_01260 [Promethearchaeota archaeon]
MKVCYYCGIESDNLKQCPKCLQYYCENHFLPEAHDCPLVPIENPYELKTTAGPTILNPNELYQEASAINQATNNEPYIYYHHPVNDVKTSDISPESMGDEEERVYTDGTYIWYKHEKGEIPEDAFNPESGVVIPGVLWPKKSEFSHFLIASVLLFIMSMTGFLGQYGQLDLDKKLILTLGSSSFYLATFLIHEFSHRQTARHFKMQTKFRLFKMGVIMTIISIMLPIKFALPGAVVIIGLENIGRETGWCKFAGPLSNLIFGSILLILGIMPFIKMPLNYLFLLGATFNYMLGAFNMLPFGILDGENIRKWRPKLWIIAFIVLIALFITSVLITYSFPIQKQFMIWLYDIPV